MTHPDSEFDRVDIFGLGLDRLVGVGRTVTVALFFNSVVLNSAMRRQKQPATIKGAGKPGKAPGKPGPGGKGKGKGRGAAGVPAGRGRGSRGGGLASRITQQLESAVEPPPAPQEFYSLLCCVCV